MQSLTLSRLTDRQTDKGSQLKYSDSRNRKHTALRGDFNLFSAFTLFLHCFSLLCLSLLPPSLNYLAFPVLTLFLLCSSFSLPLTPLCLLSFTLLLFLFFSSPSLSPPHSSFLLPSFSLLHLCCIPCLSLPSLLPSFILLSLSLLSFSLSFSCISLIFSFSFLLSLFLPSSILFFSFLSLPSLISSLFPFFSLPLSYPSSSILFPLPYFSFPRLPSSSLICF